MSYRHFIVPFLHHDDDDDNDVVLLLMCILEAVTPLRLDNNCSHPFAPGFFFQMSEGIE